jgi:DNA polymerase
VFGDGPADATLVLVGEQPGDKEDIAGLPFVGPAGEVLASALREAGIVRDDVYVTNAVKHFRWRPAGRRRIHETPRASDIRACQPWLESEIDAVEPRLIVLMGSIAVRSLLGPDVKVLVNRGHVLESSYGPCLITVHPSSILRVDDPSQREPAFAALVADLRRAVEYLQRSTRI